MRDGLRFATALAALAASLTLGGTARADEITYDWAIPYIKAPSAWQRGWTGAGVTIGIVDTGVAPQAEFSGRLQQMWNAYTGKFVTSADDQGHGTFVAGLIGAARDGKGTVGVAYGAKILALKVLDKKGYLNLSDKALGNVYDVARLQGASVLNNSWNTSTTVPELIRTYGASGAATVLNYYNAATFAAMQRFVTGAGRIGTDKQPVGGVIVFAAGNDGKADPGYWASLPYFKPGLQPGFLAVVAVGSNGAITSWSNRCGLSQAYCLAAPGDAVVSTKTNATFGTGSGTSFAAPLVTGAVAVLYQMWPYLKNADVVKILLGSANKSGIYANKAIYGQGLLDLDAATRPAGTLSIAGSTGTLSPSVTGGALGKVGATGSIVVLDAYNRSYQLQTAALTARTADNFRASLALDRFAADRFSATTRAFGDVSLTALALRSGDDAGPSTATGYAAQLRSTAGWGLAFGTGVTPDLAWGQATLATRSRALALADGPLAAGHLGLVRNAAGAAVTMPLGKMEISLGVATGTAAAGLVQSTYGLDADSLWPAATPRTQNLAALRVAMPAGHRLRIALTGGVLDERASVLGTGQSGSFGLGDGARTLFAGIGADLRLGDGLHLFAAYEVGYTRVRGAFGALIGGVETIRTDSWRVGLAGADQIVAGDSVLLAVAMPLGVARGTAAALLPTGYDGFTGTTTYTAQRASLRPERRELTLQAGYTLPVLAAADLGFGGLVRLNPNNERAPASYMAVTKLAFRF